MASEGKELHLLFFPFMAKGHMLPMIDMAKLFAARGPRVSILTTPANAASIGPSAVHLHVIPFPSTEFSLPDGCESRSSDLSDDALARFFHATASLRQPFDDALANLRPDCVVTDMFMPWTHHVAAARGVPRIVFHGTSTFARCATDAYSRWHGGDDSGALIIPGLPHRIQMLRTQFVDYEKLKWTAMEFLSDLHREGEEVEPKGYGVLLNSFYELEPDYVDYFREVMGRKAWTVGPVSLDRRGEHLTCVGVRCLEWLKEREIGSVVYVCFGSSGCFSPQQMREITLGLEASGHPFVWVVRSAGAEDWAPQGKGVVLRGWAPQMSILNHAAVGGFVTHCGWNSSLEGICAGLAMVTWPLFAEQFYNERLLVDVLRIAVPAGSNIYAFKEEDRTIVRGEAVGEAVRRVMEGGEEEEGEGVREDGQESGGEGWVVSSGDCRVDSRSKESKQIIVMFYIIGGIYDMCFCLRVYNSIYIFNNSLKFQWKGTFFL
nr:glycosyltransferase 1 [Gastrodia elata]